MDYTQSDAYVTDGATGRRMHQSTEPVTTEVSSDDLNGLIWELVELIKAGGIVPKAFDRTVPATYSQVRDAVNSLISKRAIITEAANQAAEDAAFAAGAAIVVRTDLLAGPLAPSLLMHLDGTLADVSGTGKVPILFGTGTVNSGIARFGSSCYRGAVSSGITVPYAADLNFGVGDWGISFWLKLTAFTGTVNQQTLLSKGAAGQVNSGWSLSFDSVTANAGRMYFSTSNNGAQINVVSGIADTAWHHIELDHFDGRTWLFVDGVIKGSTATTLSEDASDLTIGNWAYNTALYALTGYMDELVIVKGRPLHRATFTPPSKPY